MRHLKPTGAHLGVLAALTVAVTAGALASASLASAATLSGNWAPFTNCPVDGPAMLSNTSTYGALCARSSSPSGTFKIGNSTVTTGETDLQFGVAGSASPGSSFGQIVPATDNQTLVAAPVNVPGGLLGLMCPSNVPVVTALCDAITNNVLNNVTAQVEPAGTPTDFSAAGALTTGQPILNLPVKIQLQNPLLGSGCFIGSDSDPIVLKPQTVKTPTLGSASSSYTDPSDGLTFLVLFINGTGATLGDSTFAVPGASGCGGPLLSLLVDQVVDAKQGLPSASGNNSLVLDNVTSNLAATTGTNAGRHLSYAWHQGCVSGCS